MSIPLKELKILLLRSGNRCAFPSCGEVLVLSGGNHEEPVVIGEVAHIVAESIDGPRGDYPLPLEQRNEASNLVLLCAKDHKIIDQKPQYYTVERLRQLKEDHENRIAGTPSEPGPFHRTMTLPKAAFVTETLHSTLLPVLTLPPLVYGAKGNFKDGDE